MDSHATADFKRREAAAWSTGAKAYAANVHNSSTVMAPLVFHIVKLASSKVQNKSSSSNPQILDLASQDGELAVSLAKALPTATVAATDLAPGMVEQAKLRGQADGVANFKAEVMDAEVLTSLSDATFDVVTCCGGLSLIGGGLSLMPHPDRALAEWQRVLKPGGTLIVSVWEKPGRDMEIGLLMRQMIDGLDSFQDPLMTPAAEAVADAEHFEAMVKHAGFTNVEMSELNVPMKLPAGTVHGALLENPVIAEFLDRLVAAGRTNAVQEAEKQLLAAAEQEGFLQPDGALICPRNVATIAISTAN